MAQNRFILSGKVWSIIVGIGVVIALITGIFQVDDRYAKCQDLKVMERETVKTFNDFQIVQQVKLEAVKKGTDIQILNLKYQWIQSQLSTLRNKLSDEKNKDNKLLLVEYDNLLNQEVILKNKLNDTLMK